jgi:hypothetical protein
VKTVSCGFVLLLLFCCCPLLSGAEHVPDGTRSISNPAKQQIVVYYFHRTIRCPTCIQIEQLTREAVARSFKKELDGNIVRLRVLNLDLPQNLHFEKDYALTQQAVVVSEVTDGKENRWKNLPQIWELVNSRARFLDYIDREVTDYLKTLQ